MASLLSKLLGFKVIKVCFDSSISFLMYHAVLGESGTISSKYLSSRSTQIALLECKFVLGKSQAINDIPYTPDRPAYRRLFNLFDKCNRQIPPLTA